VFDQHESTVQSAKSIKIGLRQPMKAIVTGMNGTVAPVLARTLTEAGHTVVPWNRALVPTDNLQAAHDFIRQERPDWFFHIATGSPDWAARVAQACAAHGVRLLFTSSVSVFSATQSGPLNVNIVPQPGDEYGRYKLECEQRVQAHHPEVLVVRLGWQIGLTPGSNHMVDHLHRTHQSAGQIEASTEWFQACSFLDDTAAALAHLMTSGVPGVYHLDGNPGLSFFEVVTGLKHLLGAAWQVVPGGQPVQNNLLLDDRVPVRSIALRFSGEPDDSALMIQLSRARYARTKQKTLDWVHPP
jgi:dTDP-4-dehydrorhamnose reductase